MKLRFFCYILFMVTFFACNAQTKDNLYDERNYLFKTDTTNEVDQFCKLFIHKIDSNLTMLKCYSNTNNRILIAKMFLKKGQYNGPCTFWTDSGAISFYGEYFQNEKHGKWVYYFGDTISSENWYDKGRKVGLWRNFDKTGKVIKEFNYGN